MEKHPTVYWIKEENSKNNTRKDTIGREMAERHNSLLSVSMNQKFDFDTTSRKLSKSMINFDGFSLRFENLTIWTETYNKKSKETIKKAIIKGITSKIKSGKLVAIVGPSGAGKTTLMNFVAGRQNNTNFKTYCWFYLNNSRIEDIQEFKNIIGFVHQEDIMETRYTPRENFEYYAKLRGYPDHETIAEEIIEILGLHKCADTIVGDSFNRGISGGEKKRVSIGIQLVSDPNLLFLDEPTTGLDSSTALDIIKELHKLSQRGITTITTIHSPSTDILQYFDQILILCRGQLVYDGSPKRIPKWLIDLNFQIREFVPPLEQFMEYIDIDFLKIEYERQNKSIENIEEIEKEYLERIEKFVYLQKLKSQKKFINWPVTDRREKGLVFLRDKIKIKNVQLPIMEQFQILFVSKTKLFFKDKSGMLLKLVAVIFLSLIISLTFLDLGDPKENPILSIQNRTGFIFLLSCQNFFVGAALYSSQINPEKKVFVKDLDSKLYHPGIFFFTSILYLLPYFLIVFSLTSVIFFFMNQFNQFPSTFGNWFWFWMLTTFNALLGGLALGSVLGVLLPDLKTINTMMPMVALPIVLLGGSFASVKSFIWPLFLISYLSPVRFTFQGLILTEFQNQQDYLDNCNLPDISKNLCDPLSYHDFYESEIWLNFFICMILIIWVFYILGYVVFMFYFWEKRTIYSYDEDLISQYKTINQQLYLMKRIILFIGVVSLQIRFLRDDKENFCSEIETSQIKLTNKQIQSERNSAKNMFTNKYNDIISFLVNNDANKLLQSFLPIAVLVIIFMILVLFSELIFCFVFCNEKSRGSWQKMFTFIGIVILTVAFILFLVVMVLILISNQYYEDSLCGMYWTVATLWEGETVFPKFIGLLPLQKLFATFSQDVSKLKETRKSFENIKNENPSSFSNRAALSLRQYVQNFQETTTIDTNGELKVPVPIVEQTVQINNKIESEFNWINQVGSSIQKAAESGSSELQYITIEITAKVLTGVLQVINLVVSEFLFDLTDDVERMINVSKFSMVILIILGWVLFVFFGLVLFLLYSSAFRQKYTEYLAYGKLLLVVIGLFMIIFSVLSFIILVSNVSISSFCGFVQDVNDGWTGIFDEIDEKLNPLVDSLIEICYKQNSDGKLSTLLLQNATDFQNNDYFRILSILNGVSAYRLYQGNNTDPTQTPQGILEREQILDKYKNGDFFSQFGVESDLEQFNTSIECSSEYVVFSDNNCDQSGTCINITENQSYQLPQCVTDQQVGAQQLQNLKKYATQSSGNVTNMKQKLSTENSGPNKRYQESIRNLKSVENDMKDIYTALETTVPELDVHNVPLDDVLDCRAIRDSTLEFEINTCFWFNKNINSISAINSIIAILLFVCSWIIYFALMNDTGEKVNPLQEISKREQQAKQKMKESFDTEQGDLLNMEDGEKVPF